MHQPRSKWWQMVLYAVFTDELPLYTSAALLRLIGIAGSSLPRRDTGSRGQMTRRFFKVRDGSVLSVADRLSPGSP